MTCNNSILRYCAHCKGTTIDDRDSRTKRVRPLWQRSFDFDLIKSILLWDLINAIRYMSPVRDLGPRADCLQSQNQVMWERLVSFKYLAICHLTGLISMISRLYSKSSHLFNSSNPRRSPISCIGAKMMTFSICLNRGSPISYLIHPK